MTTMTYTPSWEKKYDPYETEPEIWDNLDDEENENAKVADEISLDGKLTIKLKYPEYSIVQKLLKKDSAVDVAFVVNYF